MSHAHHDHKDKPPHHTGMRRHAKWITIVGVALMLAAMAFYVLSENEMFRPGQPVQNSTPAIAP